MIEITNTTHTYGGEYRSIGGVGGYGYQPETTTVEWSDGTRLIVEDGTARATYHGSSYKLQRIHTSLHDGIAAHWIDRISTRLQRDVPTPLADRVRSGWSSTLPTHAA